MVFHGVDAVDAHVATPHQHFHDNEKQYDTNDDDGCDRKDQLPIRFVPTIGCFRCVVFSTFRPSSPLLIESYPPRGMTERRRSRHFSSGTFRMRNEE